MDTAHPYQGLTLDEIIEITASDAAHAPDLREQGKGLKMLADKLDESVNNLIVARSGAMDGFEGDSAQKMIYRATRLVVRGSEGHTAIRAQHQIFFDLSDQTELTHQRMLELREKRDNALANAAPEERKEIRKKYTVEARDYMRETTSGYIQSLRSSDRMKWYTGPRVSRDGEAGGPNGFEDHTTTGPTLGQTGDNGPVLQSGTAVISAEVQVGPAQGTGGTTGVHNGTGLGLFGAGTSAGAGRKRKKSSKRNKRQEPAGATERGGTSQFMPHRDVVPPVIGAHNAGESDQAGPAQRRDGLVPPVIGARGPMMGTGMHGMAAPSQSGGGQTPRTPTPWSSVARPSAPKTIRNSGAGTRAAVVRPQPAEGRVIRGGVGRNLAAPERTDFTRQPKERHGDPDNPNRAVIRNSRALVPEPAPSPRPVARSSHPKWEPESPVVEPVIRGSEADTQEHDHDPGPFLAHYNIGRNSY